MMAPPGRPALLHNIFSTSKKKPLPKSMLMVADKPTGKAIHGKIKHTFTPSKTKGGNNAAGNTVKKAPKGESSSNSGTTKTTSKKPDKSSKRFDKDSDVGKAAKPKAKSASVTPQKAEKASTSVKLVKLPVIKKAASLTPTLSSKAKKVLNRDQPVANSSTGEGHPRKQPASESSTAKKQSHLDDATSKDHYSQYGSIPSGFKYFKNVVRDLQPVAQQLKAASQKLTENSQYAHCIMERQEQMIADYIRRRARPSKKDKAIVRRNLDKFSEELDRVHSEDNRTCRESYNYVDVKIQKMDADLKAKRSIYEELAKESRQDVPNDLSVLIPKKGHKRKKTAVHPNKKPLAVQTMLPKSVLTTLPAADSGETGMGVGIVPAGKVSQPANRLDPSMVKDMPIDPHEPLYCYCKQVSFGDMIACDNPECQTEWYHFACVGITRKPTGKWFCPTCVQQTQQANMSAGNGLSAK